MILCIFHKIGPLDEDSFSGCFIISSIISQGTKQTLKQTEQNLYKKMPLSSFHFHLIPKCKN